ncbi:cytochrome P450 2F3-like [Mya arenaria]|uniref:cytochrome P450 2F3-like n=1 Tax=Mya arenaria TaxID=6604 RepID=UPI0022DFF8A1|nr:cytochrome P450 2F3-like [Mya arenaria]
MWSYSDVQSLFSSNISTGLVFLVSFLLVYEITRRHHRAPPGPQRCPLIGNLGSLIGGSPLESFAKLRSTYGDVYGIYLGSKLAVVLNGYEAIHDALVKQGRQFAWRPEQPVFVALEGDVSDLVYGNGPEWKAKRVFIMNAIKELCLSRKGLELERLILEEVNCLTERLDLLEQVNPREILSLSLANVVYSILHGNRTEYDNEDFLKFMNSLNGVFKRYMRNQMKNNLFPFILKIPKLPFDLHGLQKIKDNVQTGKSFFAKAGQERLSNHEEGDTTCLLDYLLNNDSPVPPADFWKPHYDLMAAGSETSATTLNWLILLLMHYPDIQEKLHQSIFEVIGHHPPSISDRNDLPYVEATILETLRFGSNVPLSVPHSVTEDVAFRGFIIPKGTLVLPNLASVHYDPNNFEDPLTFRPERFLSADGMAVVPSEKLIPFSLGPRACLGETLARTELFMYTTRLVQKYTFECPDGERLPGLGGVFGLTHRPQDYNVRLVKRN